MTTSCPGCGTVTVRPDQRFCTRCGAALTAAPPPPPPLPATPPPPPLQGPPRPLSGPLFADEVAAPVDRGPRPAPADGGAGRDAAAVGRRRSSRAAVIVAALALLAAGLGATGAVLLLSDGDDRTTAADATSDHLGRDDAASDVPTGAATTDPGTEPPAEPSTTAPVPAYQCWDGAEVASRRRCTTDPTGRQGLHWVFPQSQAQDCRTALPGDRVLYLSCQVPVSSGHTVKINYSQWASWDAAHRHYANLDVDGPLAWRADLQGWYIAARGDNPDHKAALLYKNAPYSVTVYGRTEADRDEGLDQLVVRPVRDLRSAKVG